MPQTIPTHTTRFLPTPGDQNQNNQKPETSVRRYVQSETTRNSWTSNRAEEGNHLKKSSCFSSRGVWERRRESSALEVLKRCGTAGGGLRARWIDLVMEEATRTSGRRDGESFVRHGLGRFRAFSPRGELSTAPSAPVGRLCRGPAPSSVTVPRGRYCEIIYRGCG